MRMGAEKEHLGLDEVPGILRRLNEEKRVFDKGRGKRIHDFFIPPGSKILVSSYVHLRREGLDGYISDFNNMVRAVWEVTGDSGIEVLPVCPVVYEGLDELGGRLINGVQDWIKWISEEGGRKSISHWWVGRRLRWGRVGLRFTNRVFSDCKQRREGWPQKSGKGGMC